jgi:tetratricopeptide (TPR) repeat protein
MPRSAIVAALFVAALPLRAQRPDLAPAVQLFERGQFAEARPLFAAAATRDPLNAETHYYLGRIALHDAAAEVATRELERATQLAPDRSVYFEWLGNAYGSQAQRANMLKQAGLARKTIAAWDKAVALDPDNLRARENRVQYYLQAPGFLGGSEDRAAAEAAEISRRNPYFGALATARLHEQKKRYDDAERTYLAAVRQFPDSMAVRYRLGFGYQALKQWDKAFSVWDEMLRLRPAEAGALYQVGRTGALSGQRLERAEQALRQYLRAAPGPGDPPAAAAHYRLGMVLQQKGDRAGARAEYEAALRLDPAHNDAKAALKKLA